MAIFANNLFKKRKKTTNFHQNKQVTSHYSNGLWIVFIWRLVEKESFGFEVLS